MRILLVAALLLASPGLSAQFNPYEASVAVADQSTATRDAGLREALSEVIGRVSGEASLGQAGPILARAPQLVQRYGFQRDEYEQLKLTAAFDPRAVEAALKAQNLPVFGVLAGPVEDVGVVVTNVRSGADYARVLATLRAVPGVKALQVLGAGGDRVDLRVRAEGGASRLAGAVSIGGVLVRDVGASGGLSFALSR